MNNASSKMKSLSEEIITSYKDREKEIKELREEAKTIRDNAREFLSDCKRLHKEMAEGLRKGLKDEREELIKNVNALREDFRKKGKEVRTDLAEASKIWNKMNETLRSKKTKSKKEVRKT